MPDTHEDDRRGLRDAIIYLKGEALRLELREVAKALASAILHLEGADQRSADPKRRQGNRYIQ